MSNLLMHWIDVHHAQLEAYGFRVSCRQHTSGGCSIDLDSSSIVGTIAHWPEKMKFEFQFNSCRTGDVLLIEERYLSDVDELNTYFKELWRTKLSAACQDSA